MADIYSEYGPGPEKSVRNPLMWLIDTLMGLVSLVMGILMFVTFLVPYINPVRVWFFPILGLVSPAIYVATVILALYWIIRWRWGRASVLVLLVVVGFFKVSLFYRPEFRRIYNEDSCDRNAFKFMTYNVRSFFGEDGQSSVPNILRLINAQDPDVVCIQEFNAYLTEESGEFALLEEKYENAVFSRTQAPDSLYGASLIILSKYRILNSGITLTPNASVWADVLMGEDTVRIFNNHLRSTAINADDNDYITRHKFLSDTASEVKIRSIATRFRENSVLRAAQVDSIAEHIAATHTRKIVCGDFNDTPMSYVYRTMARNLNDAFCERGLGYSHTFRGFFNTLRIDYVLSSEGFETLTYDVLPVDYSDHHPVVVRLKKIAINN